MNRQKYWAGSTLFAFLFIAVLPGCGSDETSHSTEVQTEDTATANDTQSDDPCDGVTAGTVNLSHELISFDWWQGEPIPSEVVTVTADIPECANLVVYSSESWLEATLVDDSLTLTLDNKQVVSGKHNAEVLVWDADIDAEVGTISVDLSALVRPMSESSRNVLVIGVDGLDGEELTKISAPVMERLMMRGLWSYAAHTQMTQGTSSGPGWTSILTGVEANVHGISSNGGYDNRNTKYPSFLYRARHELNLSTAATIQWEDIWSILEEDAYDAGSGGSMAEVSETMAGMIRSGLYQVHFSHLDDVDGAGHSVGYLASESLYYETVQIADGMIGDMVDAILERPEIETEHWLVLVTSDHGGDEWGTHGTMTSDYQTIPLIIAGPGLGSIQIDDGVGSHMDIHPTVIDFLGLNSADYGLNGTSWWFHETDCTDEIDNDGDGYIDCEDSDCDVDPACLECPSEDLGEATGVSVVAAVPFNEDIMTGSCGGAGAESSYSWTAPQDGRYSFDTVGGYRDTVLYALDGACDGEELACNDDIDGLSSGRSGFSLNMDGGETVVIVVDSYSNTETASSVLSIHPYTSSCPDGDLGGNTGTWDGSLSNEDKAHQEGCAPAVGNLEFTWVAPEGGVYTYHTTGSDFDTVIYVLDSCGGEELACNDDADYSYQSQVTFTASEGEEFIIGIGAFNNDAGSYQITIE